MTANIRVHDLRAEIQRTGTAVAAAKVRIHEVAAQVASGPAPIPSAAKVRIHEVVATVATGTTPTPNPAHVRIHDMKVTVTPGGPPPARTGAWVIAGGKLVPVRVYAASEVK